MPHYLWMKKKRAAFSRSAPAHARGRVQRAAYAPVRVPLRLCRKLLLLLPLLLLSLRVARDLLVLRAMTGLSGSFTLKATVKMKPAFKSCGARRSTSVATSPSSTATSRCGK